MGPSPKHGPDLTTSSTSCTPSVPLCTGTSVKVWKKANSPKPVKISPPSRRTTKKAASTLPKGKAKVKKENTKALVRISKLILFLRTFDHHLWPTITVVYSLFGSSFCLEQASHLI